MTERAGETGKVWHYRIQVWNNEGEIVRSEWDCDEATMFDIDDEYGERSNYDIIVQNRWQTDEPFEFATSSPPRATPSSARGRA